LRKQAFSSRTNLNRLQTLAFEVCFSAYGFSAFEKFDQIVSIDMNLAMLKLDIPTQIPCPTQNDYFLSI